MKAEAKYRANYRGSALPFNCSNIRGCRAIYVSLKKKQNSRLVDKKFWAKMLVRTQHRTLRLQYLRVLYYLRIFNVPYASSGHMKVRVLGVICQRQSEKLFTNSVRIVLRKYGRMIGLFLRQESGMMDSGRTSASTLQTTSLTDELCWNPLNKITRQLNN